jgi:hypothetical protein
MGWHDRTPAWTPLARPLGGRGREAEAGARERLALVTALVCIAAAALFVIVYATPMPLTDEWLFLRSVIALERLDLTSFEGWRAAWDVAALTIYDHCVAVPFLIYWALAGVVNFDNRAFVAITLVGFVVQYLVYLRHVLRSHLAVLPIALVVFSPAHYVEFLWGFEFTLSLSILLPMLGLVVLDRLSASDGCRSRVAKMMSGFVLVTLGALSSAAGAFGFVAAAGLLVVKPLPRTTRTLAVAVFGGAAVVALCGLSSTRSMRMEGGKVLQALTAFGALITGSPVGLTEFQIDDLSLTGLAIVGATAVVAARALALRRLPAIALPMSFVMLGGLSIAGVVLNRDWLGNWHLQHALPALCGAYAAAVLLRRLDASIYASAPLYVLTAILLLSPVGYYMGFSYYGPRYHAYVKSIEDYARRFVDEPDLKKPFPPTRVWDLDVEMVSFLKSRGHASLRSPAALPSPLDVTPARRGSARSE